jgi:hypothetical protein
MWSPLFWDVTQRRMIVTDVSGQPIDMRAFPLKVGPIGCLETSVTSKLRCLTSQKRGDLRNYFEQCTDCQLLRRESLVGVCYLVGELINSHFASCLFFGFELYHDSWNRELSVYLYRIFRTWRKYQNGALWLRRTISVLWKLCSSLVLHNLFQLRHFVMRYCYR